MCFNQLRFKPCLIAVCLLTCCIAALPTSADIFQWEYIDPLQPELGKQESTTLVPDGAGVNAVPQANIGGRDLTKAYLIGADLTGAILDQATLFDADLTGAIINGARMSKLTLQGFTAQQLYDTANYQAGNLLDVTLLGNDMAGWNFSGLDMTGASVAGSDLTGASLNNSNLTNAVLAASTLANVDMAGAVLTGADLRLTTSKGFTQQQLQSSLSFQSYDLSGVRLAEGNDLSGWDLTGQNLTGADFGFALNLSNTDFAGAVIRGANFYGATDAGFTEGQLASTASYQAGDLQEISFRGNDLTAWNLSGQDLSNAFLHEAVLTTTDFTGATVTGTYFDGSVELGLTFDQLASTANYVSGNLSAIILSGNDMSGWDFSGLDLTGASFKLARLTGADFSDTILINANLTSGAVWLGTDLSRSDLTDASFSQALLFYTELRDANFANTGLAATRVIGADTRGAINLTEEQITSTRFLRNFIRPDGTIREGMLPLPTEAMWIHDDDGNGLRGPIPITVHTAFNIDSTSTLRFLFEDSDWGSTILFDASVGTANLGGTLELSMNLDEGLTPTDLLGATFQLFDWTGVSIVGDFEAFVLDPAWFAAGLSLDRSQLITTGEVRVVSLIGDLDGDGFVGIADLNIVLMRWNQSVTPGDLLAGDVDGDGFIGIVDLNLVLGTWNAAVPPVVGIGDVVPEPGAAVLLVLGGLAVLRRRTG